MATTVYAARRSKVNPDRVFYPAMCLLCLVIVWLGFAKSYYAVGMVTAKLPSAIVHVHAVVFSLWLVTLVVQTGLISARKVKMHMTLGLLGFAFAALMVVIGLAAAVDALRRGMAPPWSGLTPETFFVIPFTDILMFAGIVAWSFADRLRPESHKRLIMVSTIVLLDAAIGRFPATIAPMGGLAQMGILFALLGVVAVYDFVVKQTIHPATVFSSLLVIAVALVRIPLAHLGLWQAFAHVLRG